MIKALTDEVAVGAEFKGKVSRLWAAARWSSTSTAEKVLFQWSI